MPARCKPWSSVSDTVQVACHAAVSLAAIRPDTMAALIAFVPYIACFTPLRNGLLKVYGMVLMGMVLNG